MNFNTRILFKVILVSLFGLLTACGGGGGDGNSSLIYQGNTGVAKITNANAPGLSGTVINALGIVGNDSLELRASSSSSPRPPSNYVQYATRRIDEIRQELIAREIKRSNSSVFGQRVDVNETEFCNSGQVHITGFLEFDFTGFLQFAFANCQDGSDFLDGVMTFTIHSFDLGNLLETSLSVGFSNLRLINADFDLSLQGNIDYVADIVTNSETETIHSLIILDNSSGEMIQIVNLVSTYTYDNINAPSTVSIIITSGQIYDSVHGFVEVEVTSLAPINFTALTQPFPDSGVVFLTADGGIKVTALSTTMVQIEVDTVNPGDGIYEFLLVLDWTDL